MAQVIKGVKITKKQPKKKEEVKEEPVVGAVVEPEPILQCVECDFIAKTPGGLKHHVGVKHKGKSVGRPTKLTDEIRLKIETIAAMDGSVEEIAHYAGISRSTLWEWCKENKELSDRIEELRNRPVLAARKRVIEGIGESYGNAMDYLSRKRPKEFGNRAKLEHEVAVINLSEEAEKRLRKYQD